LTKNETNRKIKAKGVEACFLKNDPVNPYGALIINQNNADLAFIGAYRY
jgi:hypothetical protein